ncbi:MAG: hypothetical protein J6T52_00235 [Bacteroidaceae bacterium]|nr:hypothetical protein [Bacteroidaceae bacterium]
MESEEYTGYIRCSNCGETYIVTGDDLYDEDATYHCSKCNTDIEVPFFMYCNHCEAIVGVEQGSLSNILLDVAGKAIQGFFKPASALSGLGRFFDDIPSANNWGVCKFCNTKYIRCPRCNTPVEVKPGTGDNDILYCPDCGQKMRQP